MRPCKDNQTDKRFYWSKSKSGNRIGSGTWRHIQPPKLTKKQITKHLLNSHAPSSIASHAATNKAIVLLCWTISVAKQYNYPFNTHWLHLLWNLVQLTVHIITVFLGLVPSRILFVDKLRKRPYHLIRRWLQEHRPWHPRLLLVHGRPVKHRLVFSVAQDLGSCIIVLV